LLGKRSITADTALRLSTYFGLSDIFWTNLQTRFDLEVERTELQATLNRIVPLKRAS